MNTISERTHYRLELDQKFVPDMQRVASDYGVSIDVVAKPNDLFIRMNGLRINNAPILPGHLEIDVQGPKDMDDFWKAAGFRIY